jgi:hypothetical protein
MSALHSQTPGRRIPVRLHRGVGLIRTDDAYLATELITSPKLAPYLAGRLTDRVLLIAQDAAPALIKALKQNGYPVLIVSKLLSVSSAVELSQPGNRNELENPAEPAVSSSAPGICLSAAKLPAEELTETLLTSVAPESLNQVLEYWLPEETGSQHSENDQPTLSKLLDVWQNRRFLAGWIQRHHRKHPELIWRLALLRLLRGLTLPKQLAEILFADVCRTASPSQKSVPSVNSLFVNLSSGGDDRFAHTVYIPPMLVEAAWKKVAKPHNDLIPFPSRYSEADGLDAWIGLCLIWQAAGASSLRFTSDGMLHKRDAERIHDVLGKLPVPPIGRPPSAQRWWQLASILGILVQEPGQRQTKCQRLADRLARPWVDLVKDLWNAWFLSYLPKSGSPVPLDHGNPYREHMLIVPLLSAATLLVTAPETDGMKMDTLRQTVLDTHAQRQDSVQDQLLDDRVVVEIFEEWLGMLWLLGLVQWNETHQLLRLSPLGRQVFGLDSPWREPENQPCLILQPNLEIIAYRPAVRPAKLAMLSQFAQWKATHPALVLQVDSASIHVALQSGYTVGELLAWLEQHSTREIPEAVRHLITTWAQQQQRITVYPQATLLEFDTPQDLQDCCASGIPGTALSERLFLLDESADLDFRHFRIIANIYYSQPLNPVVRLLDDGVTLEVKLQQANLLLGCELEQLADLVETDSVAQIRRYRVTPGSVARSRQHGWTPLRWQQWFLKRCGRSPSPAIQFLLTAGHAELVFAPLYILETPSETIADGLLQWSETSPYILRRLGPAALAIRAETKDEFLSILRNVGIKLQEAQQQLNSASELSLPSD